MITLTEEAALRHAASTILEIHGTPKPDDPDWMGELRLFIDDELDAGVRDELVEAALTMIQGATPKWEFPRPGKPTRTGARIGREL